MLFSTLFFTYVFLPLLLLCYWLVGPNRQRAQLVILMAFSLFFYAWGEPVYVFLMVGLVAVNFFFGKWCANDGESEPTLKKRLLLVLDIAINLGALGYFKYLNFVIDNINALFGSSIGNISVTMPIGISFFTFQAMSYVIDTYRGVTKVQKSYPKLLLYISFFPQLIAGPIVRYQDLEEQLEHHTWNANQINEGVFRFGLGLAKKVVIADSCLTAATKMYQSGDSKLVLAQWLAVIFYALQLYYDFSGYSDMAIGLGKIFGFDFPENFNYPFASKSVTEYWRRWHISLGTWFKDYLFYPVMNTRGIKNLSRALMKKKKRQAAKFVPTIIGLFCVWFMTGLWHGAAWNYIFWGLYYFVLLVIDLLWLDKARKKMSPKVESVFSHAYFLIATFFGMALFYFDPTTLAVTLKTKTTVMQNIGAIFGIGSEGFATIDTVSLLANYSFLLIFAAVFSLPVIPTLWKKLTGSGYITPAAGRIIKTLTALILIGIATVRMAGQTYSPFLYFRF
ncbi:MAG: MBOAT family protein [Clostridia bacterium]|nr:MBOAT family protein [Clostridia bacterium]